MRWAGRGDYDDRVVLPGGTVVEGRGRAHYAGLGALGRFDFDNPGRGKNYLEASFRGGELRLDHEAATTPAAGLAPPGEPGGSISAGTSPPGGLSNWSRGAASISSESSCSPPCPGTWSGSIR
jgi:hypothetical protein